jgi:hypothetical protein
MRSRKNVRILHGGKYNILYTLTQLLAHAHAHAHFVFVFCLLYGMRSSYRQ